MSDFDETRSIVSSMCDVKLKMNSYKGDIKKVDRDVLLTALRDEVEELVNADSMLNTIEEAADCINYIMTIVYQVVEEYKERDSGQEQS